MNEPPRRHERQVRQEMKQGASKNAILGGVIAWVGDL